MFFENPMLARTSLWLRNTTFLQWLASFKSPAEPTAATLQPSSVAASTERRIPLVDNMRGIAALGVCLFHCGFLGYNDYYLGHYNILTVLARLGTYGVQMFFVISGFIIPYSMYQKKYAFPDIGQFLLRRVIRIDIPYFAMILAAAAFYSCLMTRSYFKDIDLLQLALHFVYLPPFFNMQWYLGVFWTLLIEFQFYILISLALPLLLRMKQPYVIVALIAVQLIGIIHPDRRLITSHFSFFIIGIAAFLLSAQKINKPAFWSILLPSLVTSYFLSAQVMLYPIIASITGLVSVFMIVYLKWSNRVLLWLGKISYSLYLTHILLIEAGFKLLGMLGIENMLLRNLAFLLLIAACIGVAWLFYEVLEKKAVALAQKVYLKRSVVSAGKRTAPEDKYQ